MDKFYPKDFVLWRPHLLLLLIFLEVVFDCTGGSGRVLVEASGLGAYEEYCNDDKPCQETFLCDDTRQKCICPNLVTYKLSLYYDEKHGKCVSAVGKLCSMDSKEDDGLWKIECVPYANCVRPKGATRLSDVFGVCECGATFEPTEDLLCRPAMAIKVGNGDPILTMAQVGGMKEGEDSLPPAAPVEGNMNWGSQNKGSATPTTDANDDNRNLRGRTYLNTKPYNPMSAAPASGSFKSLIFLTAVIQMFLCSLLLC